MEADWLLMGWQATDKPFVNRHHEICASMFCSCVDSINFRYKPCSTREGPTNGSKEYDRLSNAMTKDAVLHKETHLTFSYRYQEKKVNIYQEVKNADY